jgi:uncharacterized protein YbjT (DUF2867 family)
MTLRYALAGASGLVGRELARQVSADRQCTELHLLLRRPLPALEALPQAQAVAWGSCAMPALPRIDTALCALGTTMATAGSQAAFRAVDYDAVLAFAQAARRAGAKRFGLVSALGADAASAVFYNRTKGEVEQAVSQLGFKHLVIVRPSLLLGNRAALGQPPRLTESLAQWFAPALTWITPRRLQPVRAETVAKGLLAALAEAPAGLRVVESDELHRLGD